MMFDAPRILELLGLTVGRAIGAAGNEARRAAEHRGAGPCRRARLARLARLAMKRDEPPSIEVLGGARARGWRGWRGWQ
jgi:hypothetical protein